MWRFIFLKKVSDYVKVRWNTIVFCGKKIALRAIVGTDNSIIEVGTTYNVGLD